MTGTVVDASALAAVLFMEADGEALRHRLKGDLSAPSLLPFEVANVCRFKMAKEPAKAAFYHERYLLLPRLAILLEPIDFERLPSLALEHGLTAYDAAYLQLALEQGRELVTLDAMLAKAWSKVAGQPN